MSQDAALLYIAMVVNADASGRLPADHDELTDILMSAGRNWGLAGDRLESAELELRAAGLVECFIGDDDGIKAEIVDFHVHNRVREDREGPGIQRPEDSRSTPGVRPEDSRSTPATSPEYSRLREEKRREVEEKGGESRARARVADAVPPSASPQQVSALPPERPVGDRPPHVDDLPPGYHSAGPPERLGDPLVEIPRLRAACAAARQRLRGRPRVPQGLPIPAQIHAAAQADLSAAFSDEQLTDELVRIAEVKAETRTGTLRWPWVLEDIGSVLEKADGSPSYPVAWTEEQVEEYESSGARAAAAKSRTGGGADPGYADFDVGKFREECEQIAAERGQPGGD